MSGTRSSRLREDGTKPGEKKLTQISRLFPKRSISGEDDVVGRPARKRIAEVSQTSTAGPSSSKQIKPTSNASKKTITEAKPNANNVISKFFLTNEDDDNDDFQSPKKRAQPVKKKIPKPTKPKKVSAKTTKQINQIKEKYFSKIVSEHSARDGVDPDQLQLALAISRSLVPDEQPDDDAEDFTQAIRTKKQKAVHDIFQRFGFKSGLEEYNSNDFLVQQTKRKPRRKWDTKCTALTRRDPKTQKTKCEARITKMIKDFVISDVCCGPRPFTQVTSQNLSSFHIAERLFFDTHSEADRRSICDFYTNNLCEISNIPAGVLLRDWSLIPGRDVSPQRIIITATTPNPDEIFLSAESKVDVNNEDVFVSAKSAQSPETEEVELDSLNTLENVANITKINLNKSYSWSVADESFNETLHVNSPKKFQTQDCKLFLRLSNDFEHEDEAESNISAKIPNIHASSSFAEDDCEINCSQKHFPLDSSIATSDPHSTHMVTIPTQRGFTRSPSPDMFADDYSDDSKHDNLSCSENPPCSLDPISSSGSNNSPLTKTEEDIVIEMYANGAVLLNESKRTSTSLIFDTNSEKDQSSDTLVIKLNYSGVSEKSLSNRTTTPTIEIDNPNKKANNVDLHVSIQEQDSDLFGEVVEHIIASKSNAEVSKTGIVVYESYDENVKIVDADNADTSIDECIEISDDENSKELDEPNTPNRSHKPTASTASKSFKSDVSIIYDSPTDEIQFSFESVNSDPETTLNSTKKSLSRKLFEKTLQENAHDQSKGDVALNDSLSFSFPSEDNHQPMPTKTLNELNIQEQVNNNNNGDSIEISDDEFEYSINICNQISPLNDNDDSIEISDDEINYSMSHESPIAQPRRRKYPYLQNNESAAGLNESLHQIFDDNFDLPAELHLRLNHEPTDELDLINQSVRSIVRKDFVSKTKPRPSGSSAGTPLRRTTSAMLGNTSNNKQPQKFLSRLDDTIAKDFSMDYDSFDDLLQGLNLPDSSRPFVKSPTPTEDEHEFTVTHDGSTFEVKIGHRCVSPKPNFEAMDSPTISRQLNKYGLKPLVRRKAIICLEHIYNRTHPFVECPSDESRLKRSDFNHRPLAEVEDSTEANSFENSTNAYQTESLILYTSKNSTSKSLPSDCFVYFMNVQSEFYLPSPPRAKRPWCIQPLHIAWFNLLMDNPRLFELILQYEPLELRLIRSTFKDIGLLFDNNDLITFFDKHCITFRTENTRNKKRSPKKVRPPMVEN